MHLRSGFNLTRTPLGELTAFPQTPYLVGRGDRRGNDFSAGGTIIERFSVGGAKIGEKQSRQSHSKYNFLQYAFFEKSCDAFENFCVESNPTLCKITFYRAMLGCRARLGLKALL